MPETVRKVVDADPSDGFLVSYVFFRIRVLRLGCEIMTSCQSYG